MLELQGIHVKDQNASPEVIIGDEKFAITLEEFTPLDATNDHRRISRILISLDLPWWFRHALNGCEQFAVFSVLAHRIRADPDITCLIRQYQMEAILRFRIPTVHQAPRLIECEHRRRFFAAHGGRGVQRRIVLGDFRPPEDRIKVEIPRPLEHPDHIVLINGQAGDALKSPCIRQR